MSKVWWFLFLIVFMGGVFWLIFFGAEKEKNQLSSMLKNLDKSINKSVREPVAPGQFYPFDKEELAGMINQFLKQAELSASFDFTQDKKIKALIAPHAGYNFSGQTAAHAFKAIRGQEINKVILIGSSHNEYLQGAVIDGNDAWQTPLGLVDLDTDLRNKLAEQSPLFKIDSGPHKPEYSLEVEVPFLQIVLKDFKLVPILISHELNDEDLNEISRILSEYIDGNALIVASSDMSHYPDYENANYADKKVIKAILTGQVSVFQETIKQIEQESVPNLSVCLCAQKPVEVVMKIAERTGADKIKLLSYLNSGNIDIGDKTRVVGYGAFAFMGGTQNYNLNQEQKQKLLEIAKSSVEKYILDKQTASFNTDDPLLNEKLGVFVTLKKRGQLRGCIGLLESDIPLYQVVSQMAIAAAVKDNRFVPVQSDELNDLEYEISVLSPLRKIDSWKEIEIGKHGVQIRKGSNSGVFLPQVATENNWDLDKFMAELCFQKVGLEKNCWKSNEVDIYVFTAEVF